MSTTTSVDGWALEVIRGEQPGRAFPLPAGETVLGNAPGPGVDLAGQEAPASPRKMAARHASVTVNGAGLAVRDLESPGGTFVNRRRVLPGQATPLQAGDVVQLGGVQLRVVARAAAPAPPPMTGPFSFAIPGGTTCRTWDDFLTASAQRWGSVREELISGRLAAFVRSIGRADLAPSPDARGSADERLDAWLGSLPTTRSSRPELDVHPSRLVVRAAPGGGTIRKSVRVSNVGYRLLRSTAWVEPPGLAWLAVAPDFAGKPFETVEGVDLPVEFAIPETLPGPLKAELVIEGNGGSRRVEVVLEAKPAADLPPSGAEPEPAASGATLGELVARQSPAARVGTWGMAALALRLVVGVAGGSIGEDAMKPSGPDAPSLGGVAPVLAVLGALAGSAMAARWGGRREAPAGGFAGGCVGVIVGAVVVAGSRAVEPALGAWSGSIVGVCLLWAGIGAGLAGISALLVRGKS